MMFQYKILATKMSLLEPEFLTTMYLLNAYTFAVSYVLALLFQFSLLEDLLKPVDKQNETATNIIK